MGSSPFDALSAERECEIFDQVLPLFCGFVKHGRLGAGSHHQRSEALVSASFWCLPIKVSVLLPEAFCSSARH